MISNVTIKNFKNLRDVSIDLERFTVFVGANGSGNTSVLQAIELLVQADLGNPNWEVERLSQANWLCTRGCGDDEDIMLAAKIGESLEFHLGFFPSTQTRESNGQPTKAWGIRYKTIPIGVHKFDRLQIQARPLVFLKLNPSKLAEPSYSESPHPVMLADGSGLASVLAYMALNDPDAFDELVDHFRELIPTIRRIRFRKVTVQRSEIETITIGSDKGERTSNRSFVGDAILFDYQNAKDVAVHTASDGTLIILGLLTVLLGPNRPKTVLLDDIEHALHPLAQKQLVEMIGRILERFPDLQIIATAHSPYLLNYLKPEQIRIMATDEQGHAHCGRLTDHPKFEKWKDELAPGEMWSLFGEKWVGSSEIAK